MKIDDMCKAALLYDSSVLKFMNAAKERKGVISMKINAIEIFGVPVGIIPRNGSLFYVIISFCLHHGVQNGSVPHPASYPMGTRCSFPGGKAAGS
jgi:hypothetical protein